MTEPTRHVYTHADAERGFNLAPGDRGVATKVPGLPQYVGRRVTVVEAAQWWDHGSPYLARIDGRGVGDRGPTFSLHARPLTAAEQTEEVRR